MRTFIIHWLDGTTETIKGGSIANAFNRAGYGVGALRVIDFWEEVK